MHAALPILTQEPAPEWQVSEWFNHEGDLSLAALRGRVVAVETFQMLCPGCVMHGLPQATRLRQACASAELTVLGLHTVFEHHDVMGRDALATFLHEYRIGFPVGIDRPGEGPIPLTMELYALRGTPSLLLFDRNGRLRASHFGQVTDPQLGLEVGSLLAEL